MPVRLFVVYDLSAVTLPEVVNGLDGLGDLTFVVAEPHSPHVAAVLPLLEDFGAVAGVGDVLAGRGPAPDGVVTFSERMVPSAIRIAERYGLPGPGPVDLLTDKFAQRRRLAERGVDALACARITSPGQWHEAFGRIGAPAIIKPVRGEASRNVVLVTDEDAGLAVVRSVFARAAEEALLVEDYLAGEDRGPFGDYVSVESATAAGTTSHIAVTGKWPLAPPFREPGQFWPDALDDGERAAVLGLVGSALRALEVDTAITHTEVKLTSAGPRIIEVNGRLGGNLNDLSIRSTGVDLVRVAGEIALGEAAPDSFPAPGRVVFQHSELAPTEPCRVSRVVGGAALRRSAHVDRYRTLVRSDEVLDAGASTKHLDMICGHAADHEEMVRVMVGLRAGVTFAFEAVGE